MAMDHEKIKNWIDLFGFRIYGRLGQAAGGKDERDPFHAVATYMLKALKKWLRPLDQSIWSLYTQKNRISSNNSKA